MEFVTSTPGSDPIIVEGYLAATPAEVFEAWTTPAIVMQWFGLAPNSLHSATIDLCEGGAWQFVKTKDKHKSVGFEGTYLDIQHNKKLVFTWSLVTALADGTRDATPPSRVEVEFISNGVGTDLRLKHTALDMEALSIGFGRGWNIALGSLSSLMNGELTTPTKQAVEIKNVSTEIRD